MGSALADIEKRELRSCLTAKLLHAGAGVVDLLLMCLLLLLVLVLLLLLLLMLFLLFSPQGSRFGKETCTRKFMTAENNIQVVFVFCF